MRLPRTGKSICVTLLMTMVMPPVACSRSARSRTVGGRARWR